MLCSGVRSAASLTSKRFKGKTGLVRRRQSEGRAAITSKNKCHDVPKYEDCLDETPINKRSSYCGTEWYKLITGLATAAAARRKNTIS